MSPPSSRTWSKRFAPTLMSRRRGCCVQGSSKTTRPITHSWCRHSKPDGLPASDSTFRPNTSGQRSVVGFRTAPLSDLLPLVLPHGRERRFRISRRSARAASRRQTRGRALDGHAEPGYEVEGMSGPLRVMGLEGALKSTETESSPAQWPPAGTDFNNPPAGSAGRFLNELEEKVNLQFNLQQPETSNNPHPDPIVSPPLYGRWYAMAEKLDVQQGTGWVNELNRDPRLRTPAGAGTQVIQKEQEKFMQQAWAQLGDLLQTNQKIRQFQLGWMSSFVAIARTCCRSRPTSSSRSRRPCRREFWGARPRSQQQVKESRLPRAAIDPGFSQNRPAERRDHAQGRAARHCTTAARAEPVERRARSRPPQAPPSRRVRSRLTTQRNRSSRRTLPEWLAALLRKASLPVILAGAGALAIVLRLLKGTLGLALGVVAIATLLPVLKSLIARFRAAEALRESFQQKSFKPARRRSHRAASELRADGFPAGDACRHEWRRTRQRRSRQFQSRTEGRVQRLRPVATAACRYRHRSRWTTPSRN